MLWAANDVRRGPLVGVTSTITSAGSDGHSTTGILECLDHQREGIPICVMEMFEVLPVCESGESEEFREEEDLIPLIVGQWVGQIMTLELKERRRPHRMTGEVVGSQNRIEGDTIARMRGTR